MKRQKRLLQLSAAAVFAAALSFPSAISAQTSGSQPAAVLTIQPTSAAKADYTSYVTQQYGIKLAEKVTREQFASALSKVAASTGNQDAFIAAGESKLAVWEAVSAAVSAANQKELAATYSEDKVRGSLAQAGLSYEPEGSVTLAAAQDLAVALDLGLVPTEAIASVKATGDVSAQLAYHLLGKVAEYNGHYQNFLGTIASEDIYGKVVQAWHESQIIKAGELQQLVDEILKQDLITGYNLKDAAFDPRFDPKRTITYGHSDIVHAIQLIGLLKSEGIDAKVQLEPKTSAFIYLKEWGEPVQTEDYQVVQIENGNYIAYSKEYDLSFEFVSEEAKERFQPLVLQYAKKNEEEHAGLLRGSWWQPLYYSLTELADYPVITNNFVQDGRHIVQTFSLNEDSNAVVNAFKKIGSTVEVRTYTFWVDQPFYNYLKGDDFK